MDYEILLKRYKILKARDKHRAQKLIKLQYLHCVIRELWNIQYFVCFAEQEYLYKKLINLRNILESLKEE